MINPTSDKCFDLHSYVEFQALVSYLLAGGQILTGSSQEENFGDGLASSHKNKSLCSAKAADFS